MVLDLCCATTKTHQLMLMEGSVADVEAHELELRVLVAVACFPILVPYFAYQRPTVLRGWHGSFGWRPPIPAVLGAVV